MEFPAAMCTFLAIDASKDLGKQSLWEMCCQSPGECFVSPPRNSSPYPLRYVHLDLLRASLTPFSPFGCWTSVFLSPSPSKTPIAAVLSSVCTLRLVTEQLNLARCRAIQEAGGPEAEVQAGIQEAGSRQFRARLRIQEVGSR